MPLPCDSDSRHHGQLLACSSSFLTLQVLAGKSSLQMGLGLDLTVYLFLFLLQGTMAFQAPQDPGVTLASKVTKVMLGFLACQDPWSTWTWGA